MTDFEIQRLDDDGIIEMARGIVMGDRYFYTEDALRCRAHVFLLLMDIDQSDAEQIGMVVGDVSSAVRAVNGHPMAMHGWLVHVDDTPAVLAKVDEYFTALGYDTKPEGGEEE